MRGGELRGRVKVDNEKMISAITIVIISMVAFLTFALILDRNTKGPHTDQ